MSKVSYENNILEDNEEKTKNKTDEVNELTLFQKLVFAIAGAPYLMFFSAISVYITYFLLEEAKLPPGSVS